MDNKVVCQTGHLISNLKKQWLLMDKEQRQKNKIKGQIDQAIQNYYKIKVQLNNAQAKLITDDDFGNFYNFIKDVIIGLSGDIQFGLALLKSDQIPFSLINMLINGLYESISEQSPYDKQITRLISLFMIEKKNNLSINNQEKQENNSSKIMNCYLNKEEHLSYFRYLAQEFLNQILSVKIQGCNSFLQRSSSYIKDCQDKRENCKNRKSIVNQSNTFRSSLVDLCAQRQSNMFLQEIKKNIVSDFMDKIFRESDLCPLTIKIPLKALFTQTIHFHNICTLQSKKIAIQSVWNIIYPRYLLPFKIIMSERNHKQLDEPHKILLNDIIIQLQFKMQSAFNNELHYVEKIVQKLVNINDQKYQLMINRQKNKKNCMISLNGGCVNKQQLYDLFVHIHANASELSSINAKIVNRVNKIYEMSPNLSILKQVQLTGSTLVHVQLSRQYIILINLSYDPLIEFEYNKIYEQTYQKNQLKNILRKVIVQMSQQKFTAYSRQKLEKNFSQKPSFKQLFSGILQNMECIYNQERNIYEKISNQLVIKIKYVQHLLLQSQDESNLINEMLKEYEERREKNLELYEITKFSLMSVLSNIKHLLTNLEFQQKQKIEYETRIQMINIMEQMSLPLCLTSPYSRNNSDNNSCERDQKKQTNNKYLYRLSYSDDIIIASLTQCIHQDNISLGQLFHSNNLTQFLEHFCELKEVRQIFILSSFLKDKKSEQNFLQSTFRFGKIKNAFNLLKSIVIEKYIENNKKNNNIDTFKKILNMVILRIIHEKFVYKQSQKIQDEKNCAICTLKDRQFKQRLEQLSYIYEINSKVIVGQQSNNKKQLNKIKKQIINPKPVQSTKSTKSVKSVKSSTEVKDNLLQNQINIRKMYELGAKNINNLNKFKTPNDKITQIKSITDIYQILLGVHKNKKQTDSQELYKLLIRAKPINFITNLTFIEVFMEEQKILSSDGRLLDQLKDISQKIYNQNISQYLPQQKKQQAQQAIKEAKFKHKMNQIAKLPGKEV